MKIRIALIITLSLLSQTVSYAETVDLNSLVKTQQDIDRSNRQENKIIKKDVYSSQVKKQVDFLDFPVEKNCLTINTLTVENDFLNNSTIRKIKKSVAGKCLGARGIEQLAIGLQDYYINSGYVTTRVDVPGQNLTTHQLKLVVMPGRIENIIISDGAIRPGILPFKAEDILNLRDIEQGLEVLQKAPNVKVKINIEPGHQNGYSNVVINADRTKNWNGKVWMNNWGDEATGKVLAGGAAYLYNLAHMNDTFYLSGTTNTERSTGGYKSVSAYYSVPWGYWDYELFYSSSRSKQNIALGTWNYKYTGDSDYLSLKGNRTVYRDSNKKVALSAEVIKRKVDYKLEDIELALQKRDMTNARFGINYKQNFDRALLDSTLSYQRFVPFLGGEKTPDMKSGDVSAQSNLYNLNVNYTKLFNVKNFVAYYALNSGVQYSPDKLTLQDQFTLGDRWNVRGFENTPGLYGDKGFYAQNTFNLITGIKNIEWYTGVDYGEIWGEAYPQGAYSGKKLVGATSGFKGNINTLSYDIALSTPLLYPDELNADKLNVNFTVSYQL